jgi:hypothetical protein
MRHIDFYIQMCLIMLMHYVKIALEKIIKAVSKGVMPFGLNNNFQGYISGRGTLQ